MAYWALEALDGSKTALSSLDRVEGTDPPAYKLGRRPHEESHFGTPVSYTHLTLPTNREV